MNLTRTRAARILMVGATLGMTIGLASSGLTAAAADDLEPPTAEQVTNTAPATTEPVVTPPAPEPPTAPAATGDRTSRRDHTPGHRCSGRTCDADDAAGDGEHAASHSA